MNFNTVKQIMAHISYVKFPYWYQASRPKEPGFQ